MQNLRVFKDKINDHQTPIDKISDFEFQKFDFFLDNLQSDNNTSVAHHCNIVDARTRILRHVRGVYTLTSL